VGGGGAKMNTFRGWGGGGAEFVGENTFALALWKLCSRNEDRPLAGAEGLSFVKNRSKDLNKGQNV